MCFLFISFFEVLLLLRMLARLFFLKLRFPLRFWDVGYGDYSTIFSFEDRLYTVYNVAGIFFCIFSLSSFLCLLSLSSYLEGSFFCQGAVSIGSSLAEKKWKLTVLGRTKGQNSTVEFEWCLTGKMARDIEEHFDEGKHKLLVFYFQVWVA